MGRTAEGRGGKQGRIGKGRGGDGMARNCRGRTGVGRGR